MATLRIPSPRGAFRVWQRNMTIFRKYWKTLLLPNFFEPLLYLAALGLGLGTFIQRTATATICLAPVGSPVTSVSSTVASPGRNGNMTVR